MTKTNCAECGLEIQEETSPKIPSGAVCPDCHAEYLIMFKGVKTLQ